MGWVFGLLFLLGPFVALGIWLWLRSRRAPVYLAEPLDIGRLFANTFWVFRPENWPVIVLGAAVIGVTQVATILIQQDWIGTAGAIVPGQLPTAAFWQATSWRFAVTIAATLIGLLFHIPAIAFLVSGMEGGPITLGVAAHLIPGRLPRVLGIYVLFLLGTAIGMILFVVPGVVLMLSWSVAFVASIVERHGVIDSLRRSRELAIGSRGRILLAFILFGILVGLIFYPIMALLLRYAPGNIAMMATVQPVIGVVGSLLGAGFGAALFVELRRIREGGASPALAQVFA